MENLKSEIADLEKEDSDTRNLDPTLALCEILSLVISVLIVEWAIVPLVGKDSFIRALALPAPIILAFALMVFSHRLRRETFKDLGFRFDNFVHAARLLLLPMIVITVFLFITGWILQSSGAGAPRERAGFSLWLPVAGVAWGLVQQYALQSFVNRRAQEVWGRGTASVIATAIVFAALHLPNPWLTVATFIAGCLWAYIFQRAPNLFALAISHSLLTIVLISTIPESLLGGLRVGYNYFFW
jgi:uncharacterized protein